jgi:DNA-binding MarR family transcriptional regulator
VVLTLWEQDGTRMGALAHRARLSKQTMTTLVRLAERDGLVERRADPTDRRAARVWLTAAAVALAPTAAAAVADLDSRVESALGPRATRMLHHALNTITTL